MIDQDTRDLINELVNFLEDVIEGDNDDFDSPDTDFGRTQFLRGRRSLFKIFFDHVYERLREDPAP